MSESLRAFQITNSDFAIKKLSHGSTASCAINKNLQLHENACFSN